MRKPNPEKDDIAVFCGMCHQIILKLCPKLPARELARYLWLLKESHKADCLGQKPYN